MPSKDPEKNRAAFKKWYEANKKKQIARVKENQKRIIKEIEDYKASNPCCDCDQFYPSYVMDFDHRIPQEKFKNVSYLVRNGSRKQVWEEIEKCDLVCSNCHRIRTHKNK